MNRVTVHEVTRANWRDALRLAVRPDQQRFVAEYAPIVAILLSKAYVRALGMIWEPHAFVVDSEMVGLAALAAEPEHADLRWIFHFFIDERFQGRGYGREALAALMSQVKVSQPVCRSLQLTVHPENHVAQRLYLGMGFMPTGAELDGEPVYRLALSDTRDLERETVTDEITIRPATRDDVAQIEGIVNAAYAKYLDRMDKPPAPMLADYGILIACGGVFVLASPQGIVGVLVMEAHEHDLLVENVAVRPAFQGQGLGRRLIAFAEQHARTRGLRAMRLYTNEVMIENLAFYRRLGFEEVERRLDDGYRRVFLRKPLVG
jgi:diamine N-acetyltransferase